MVLWFVKEKHCGKAELARFRANNFQTGSPDIDPNTDISVEAIVDDLLRLSIQVEENKHSLITGCPMIKNNV